MKICTVVGARPQFIKAAVVSREIASDPKVDEIIVHTGQHYDSNMSDIFFKELDIPKPNYHLGIGGGTHGQNTGRMLEAIETVLVKERPDWVLVYGDTDSTLAGALAATKLHLPVAHVEAGLRSFNRKMPEEVNRILTDHMSARLFTPTDTATKNLEKEGIMHHVKQVGDVMQDAALYYQEKAKPLPNLTLEKNFVLCTIHRAENTDDKERLLSIFNALNLVSEQFQVILPLHPRTQKMLMTLGFDLGRLTVLEPVGYLEMVWLLQHCALVMTDSGGLQKEAFFFRKPCVTVRDETEWVELVECGANLLVDSNTQAILQAVNMMHAKTIRDENALYGGGFAASRILGELF